MRPDFKYIWEDDSFKDLEDKPGHYVVDTKTEAETDENGNLLVTYRMSNVRRVIVSTPPIQAEQ